MGRRGGSQTSPARKGNNYQKGGNNVAGNEGTRSPGQPSPTNGDDNVVVNNEGSSLFPTAPAFVPVSAAAPFLESQEQSSYEELPVAPSTATMNEAGSFSHVDDPSVPYAWDPNDQFESWYPYENAYVQPTPGQPLEGSSWEGEQESAIPGETQLPDGSWVWGNGYLEWEDQTADDWKHRARALLERLDNKKAGSTCPEVNVDVLGSPDTLVKSSLSSSTLVDCEVVTPFGQDNWLGDTDEPETLSAEDEWLDAQMEHNVDSIMKIVGDVGDTDPELPDAVVTAVWGF